MADDERTKDPGSRETFAADPSSALIVERLDRMQALLEQQHARIDRALTETGSYAQTVAQLRAELDAAHTEMSQRATELALINRVQHALTEQVDMQAIIDIVGDKIREIFNAQSGYIAMVDYETNLIYFPYDFIEGRRISSEPMPLGTGTTSVVIETRRPILMGDESDPLRAISVYTEDDNLDGSWLGVPMIVGDKVLGVITLQDSTRFDAFTESDMNLLSTLAQSTGVALENVRLFEETKRLLTEADQRAAELATVNAVGQALVSELDLRSLFGLTGERVRQTFEAYVAWIAIHDKLTDRIHFPYAFGEDDGLASIDFGEGFSSRILATRKPLLINSDLAGYQARLPVAPVGVQSKSFLGVPILSGDEAIGVIAVEHTERENFFSDRHVALLTTLAATVGVAIQNARLYEAAQRSASETAALAEVGREISAKLDLEKVLRDIATRAKEMMSARDIVIRLLEPDGSLPAVVALGKYPDKYAASKIHLGEGITGRIAKTGIAEIVNFPLQDSRIVHVPGTEEDEEYEAILFAPLISRERVIGMMVLWRDRREAPPLRSGRSRLCGWPCQAGRDRDRECSPVCGRPRGESRGRSGGRSQECLPRVDEPRDSNSPQRRNWHDGAAAGDGTKQRAAGVRRDCQHQWRDTPDGH